MEIPKINLQRYDKLINNKGGKNIQQGKVFSINGAGKTGQLYAKQ